MARAFDNTVTLDRSFRPLTGKIPQDIALSSGGELYYLFDDRWLSNGDAGKPLGHFAGGTYSRLCVAEDGSVLLAGAQALGLASETRCPIPGPSRWPRRDSSNSEDGSMP